MSAGTGRGRERGGGDKLDLNDLLPEHHLTAELRTPETPAEQGARLEREREEALHQRRIFWAMFALLVTVALVTLLFLALSDSAGNQEWARTTLSAISGGIVGYVTGSRASGGK